MKKPLIALCLCISLFSCKKGAGDNIKNGENSEEDIAITRESMSISAKNANELKYRLILPETLQVNKPYNAVSSLKVILMPLLILYSMSLNLILPNQEWFNFFFMSHVNYQKKRTKNI